MAGLDQALGMVEFELAKLDHIYGSGVPVLIVDIPEGDPRAEAVMRPMDVRLEPGQFESYLKHTAEFIRDHALVQKSREDFILERFIPQITEYIAQNSELKSQARTNVLVNYGSLHTRLYIQIKKMGYEAERAFPLKPYTFSHVNELIRRYMFDKECSRELICQAAAETLLQPFIYAWVDQFTKQSDKKQLVMRNVCDELNEEEIHELYEILSELSQPGGTNDRLQAFMTSKLDPLVPSSREELDELLALKGGVRA